MSKTLQIDQNQFQLRCQYEILLTHPSVLVATIGSQVVSVSNRIAAKQSSEAQTTSTAEFLLELDKDVLCANLDSHIELTLFNHSKSLLSTLSSNQVLINALSNPFDVENIAPSYGFFGGGRNEALSIDIADMIAQIHLQIVKPDAYLNLREICCYDENNVLIPVDENVFVTFSTSKNSDAQATNVLRGQGFHSERENDPWLKIHFNVPCFIKRIEISNRADFWGCRSQRLTVNVINRQREKRIVYAPFSEKGIATFYGNMCQKLGVQILESINYADKRKRLLEQLYRYLSDNIDKLQPTDLVFALQFLTTWSNKSVESEQIHHLQLQIFVIYVFIGTRKKLNFTLLTFEKLLTRSTDLDFVEHQLNQLRHNHKLPELQLTKHGVAYKGILSQNVSKMLHSIQIVIEDLQALGLKPCIAYGTLLGAYRDNMFIPHDDDVDLLVEFDQPNLDKRKVFMLTEELLQKLDQNKYRTNLEVRDGENLNIHIFVKETNMVLDIFPYWNDNGLSFLHMEKMTIRGIKADILSGRKMVELYDHTFPAPGDPESFLLERYGEGWSVSNKYHEWPWQLHIEGEQSL